MENKEQQPGKIEQGCGEVETGVRRKGAGRGNRERGKEMTGNKEMEEGAERQGRGPQIVGRHPLEGMLSAPSGVPSVRPEQIPCHVRASRPSCRRDRS